LCCLFFRLGNLADLNNQRIPVQDNRGNTQFNPSQQLQPNQNQQFQNQQFQQQPQLVQQQQMRSSVPTNNPNYQNPQYPPQQLPQHHQVPHQNDSRKNSNQMNDSSLVNGLSGNMNQRGQGNNGNNNAIPLPHKFANHPAGNQNLNANQQFANVDGRNPPNRIGENNAGNLVINNSGKANANLSFTMDDVGRAIEVFSYRLNAWERLDLVDFEQSKRQFKCQFPDGSIQWLDLSKKPTRSLHDEVTYR
jgi:hypothetical protein